MSTDTRNASLNDLAALLKDQQARKLDVVVPASKIHAEGGWLRIEGSEAILTDEGVSTGDGLYRPTAVCDEGVADKLSIPLAYLRRMREERPDLWDANVNGWLHGHPIHVPDADVVLQTEGADKRAFLVRCFRADDSGRGIARAFLSNGYKMIDHLDVLTSALGGVRDAGVEVEIAGCDLTDRKMSVRVTCPAVEVLAPRLMERYRDPRTGGMGKDDPRVWAGFVISNSETGGGAFTITPRVTILVCRNGATRTQDALRSIHVGGRLEEGVIRWSEATQEKSLELVFAQARDAVRTFLDRDYLERLVQHLESGAETPLEDPAEAIKLVGSKLRFTQGQIDGVLDAFIKGADPTVGGVFQAVTYAAQLAEDADEAFDMEAAAFAAFDEALRLARRS